MAVPEGGGWRRTEEATAFSEVRCDDLVDKMGVTRLIALLLGCPGFTLHMVPSGPGQVCIGAGEGGATDPGSHRLGHNGDTSDR